MSPAAPPLLSGRRLTTLLASILVSLASGTNYVFSAYGPQLAKRLSISHTKLNLIGISGNVGVYASAPLWGKLVDARGPKPGFICAFVLLLVGYMGVKRATATGLVLSGFGLSAFLFSTVSHVIFARIPPPGNTSHFLTLLALGTALPQLVGLAFVRAVPHEEDYAAVAHVEDRGHHGGEGYAALPGERYAALPGGDGVPGIRVEGEDEVIFDAGGLGAPRYRAANTSRTPLLAAEEGRVSSSATSPTHSAGTPRTSAAGTPRTLAAGTPRTSATGRGSTATKTGDLILHSESDEEDEDVGFAPRSQHGVGQHGVGQHAVQPSMTPAIAYIPDAAEGVELSASPRSGSRGSVERRMSPSLDRGSLERRISHDVEVNASRGSLEYRSRLNASRSRGVDAGRSLSRNARLLHEAEHAHLHRDGRRPDHSPDTLDESEEDEQDALLAPEVLIHPSHAHHHHEHPHAHGYEPANVHGRALFTSLDFWLLFVIVSTLSGTGLMYINNVGSMAQALYAGSLAEARVGAGTTLQPPAYDDAAAAALQATQVSILSVMNCAGRIVIGLASDFVKTRLGRVRSVLLVGVALSLFVSQVLAGNIDDPSSLWMATALLGFSYGSLFGVMPAVIIEWFGMVHFSENWGFISLAPMFAGNLFSLAFGRNLDREGERGAREAAGVKTLARFSASRVGAIARAAAALWRRDSGDAAYSSPAPAAAPDCVAGRSCYVATLHLTAFCCFCALLLSVYAVWRDERTRGTWRRM